MSMQPGLIGLIIEVTHHNLADYLSEPKLFGDETGRMPLKDADAERLHARAMHSVEKALNAADRAGKFDTIPANCQVVEVTNMAAQLATDTAERILTGMSKDGISFTPQPGWIEPTQQDQDFATARLRMLASQATRGGEHATRTAPPERGRGRTR